MHALKLNGTYLYATTWSANPFPTIHLFCYIYMKQTTAVQLIVQNGTDRKHRINSYPVTANQRRDWSRNSIFSCCYHYYHFVANRSLDDGTNNFVVPKSECRGKKSAEKELNIIPFTYAVYFYFIHYTRIVTLCKTGE